MAHKLKPFLAAQADFTESLDHFVKCSMRLRQAVRGALAAQQISEPAANVLKRRCEAWEKATLANHRH